MSTPKLTLEGLIREASARAFDAFETNCKEDLLAWDATTSWLESKRPAELVALPAELETALQEWRSWNESTVPVDRDLATAIDKWLPKEGA